ncbi:MAG: winged helix-turn-helix transcriptional regulator [Rhizobium sp.]|nr:winged helix-turn-helix transcriptional regulator [Rhizobium sp.]
MTQNEQPTPSATTGEPDVVIKVLEGRWKLPILFQLSRHRTMRFTDLARSIPNISKRMLAQQLKQMQIDGLVCRLTFDGTAIRIEYQLTDWGKALRPSLASLTKWRKAARKSKRGVGRSLVHSGATAVHRGARVGPEGAKRRATPTKL